MKVMLDEGAILPTRAHSGDAGLDLYTPVDVAVPGCEIEEYRAFTDWGPLDPVQEVTVGSVVIDTGVHVAIPFGYTGFIKSKSGLNVKHGLTADGVIDNGYTGSIAVKLYNHTSEPYHFKAGDKIAQLVILPCELWGIEEVHYMDKTERGDGGFGSTGR